MSDDVRFGEAWVYESIVGALPGVDLSPRVAVGLQLVGFEAGVLVLGWWYGLERGVIAGSVAVAVAAVGSAAMLDLGTRIRALPAPASYRRLLFGSSIEVVLGLLAYVALLTYLFAVDPADGDALLTDLLGAEPPAPALYLLLLIMWDLCYRIGTGWWAAVAALYRSRTYAFDDAAAAGFRRIDLENAGFALVQVALIPLVADHPLLALALAGHAAAVLVVVAASVWLLGATRA